MEYIKEILEKETGEKWPEKKIKKLFLYRKAILKWNQSINLTAVRDEKEFVRRHYADSLLPIADRGRGKNTDLIKEALIESRRIIDVGTGGGFPGIPLAVYFEDKEFSLLDSLQKRLRVIDEAADEAGINNVTTIHARAEDAGRESGFRESFDLCVSRAVAALPVLLELCLPFVRKGGYFLAYKGRSWREELDKSGRALSELGGKAVEIIETDVTDVEGEAKAALILVEKTEATVDKYPRKAGKAAKQPL